MGILFIERSDLQNRGNNKVIRSMTDVSRNQIFRFSIIAELVKHTLR